METLLLIIILIVMLVGLAGTVIPLLPGAPIILAAAIIYALVTKFVDITSTTLLWLTALTAVSLVLDWVAQVVGVKRMGGSWAGIIGSIAGMIVGLMVPGVGLVGFIVGAFAGAVAGELLVGRREREALRAGIGSFVGFVVGGVAKFAIGAVMIGVFVWQVAS